MFIWESKSSNEKEHITADDCLFRLCGKYPDKFKTFQRLTSGEILETDYAFYYLDTIDREKVIN